MPIPTLRPSAQPFSGTWQVAHDVFLPETRGSKKSFSPKAIASGLPDTRLLGSRAGGGGQGPCWRIVRRSSSEKSRRTSSGACASPRQGRSAVTRTAKARKRFTSAPSPYPSPKGREPEKHPLSLGRGLG